MPYGGLVEFIRKSRAHGVSDSDITIKLAGAGWYHSDIHDALILETKLTDIGMPITKETIQEPVIIKDAPPTHRKRNAVIVAALAFVVTFIIAYVF